MQAYIEKEDSKKLKQKQRERMQPKMGKMDIDYQVTSIVYCFLCASFFFFFFISEIWRKLFHHTYKYVYLVFDFGGYVNRTTDL